MQHSINDGDLSAYVDGEVPPDRRGEIDSYLVAEPAQAARVETWQRQNEILRAAFGKVAAEPLPLSHMLALSPPTSVRTEPRPRRGAGRNAGGEPGYKPPVSISRREQNSRIAGLMVAAFAAGALVTMLAAELSGIAGGLLPDSRTAHSTPVLTSTLPFDEGRLLAARAIEAYHTYALDMVRPVEIDASRQPFLVNWLSRRVGVMIDVPDLSIEGLKLLGGRLTPGEQGPAAFLLYETTGGDRIGLMIGRAGTNEPHGLRYVEEYPASAAYWLEGGAGYALTGSTDRSKLMQIARFLSGERGPNTPP